MDKISVTRAVSLLQCSRQGWMTLREDFDWLSLPSSEAQALGTVSHKVAEEIDRGGFDQTSDGELFDAVLNRWNELVASAFEEMKSQSLFGSPALPKRWPFYVMKQAAALDRATFRRQMRAQGGGARRPEVEVFLESESLQLVGRADKIEYLGENVRIVDLKTAENPGGAIPTVYQYQLALYSALWREKTGQLPISVAIEWQDGSRSFAQVNEKEIDEIVQRLSDLRIGLLSSNVPAGAASEVTCRYCNFRTLCPEFQTTDRSTWVRQSPFIVGRVEQIIGTRDDRVLVIQTHSSQPPSLERVVVHKFSSAQSCSSGDFVAFDRLSWRGGDGNFDVVWNSRYRNFGEKIPEFIESISG